MERPDLPFAQGDDPHQLTLSHDAVLVLFELFERLEEENSLRFRHPGEMSALGTLTSQLLPPLWEVFDARYGELVDQARGRLSHGFDGYVEGLGFVKVEEDGSLSPGTPYER
jgi:hypothetical protein